MGSSSETVRSDEFSSTKSRAYGPSGAKESPARWQGGANLNGVPCELHVFDETGLLPVPDYLSDAEAAALPCAGVTAWSAIVSLGRGLQISVGITRPNAF